MIDPHFRRVLVARLSALAVFIGALWAIQILNWAMGYNLNFTFGLIPRHVSGLDGIVGMPLLHGSFSHLVSNTVPLLLLGGLLAATATRALLALNGVIIVLGGALVWLFAGSGVHIGASGLVFGWFGFLMARGLVDRSPKTLAAALAVGLVYGSLIWGVLPGQPGVSWEGHLFGALAGVIAAFVVRSRKDSPRASDPT